MVAYPLSSTLHDLDYPKLAWQFVTGDFDGDDRVRPVDFAIFAISWLGSDSSFFRGGSGPDCTNDCNVDFNALKDSTENWLAGREIDY